MVVVALVRSNSTVNDPRLWKLTKSLSKKYEPVVLGWNRDGVSKNEYRMHYQNTRLFELRAPIGKNSVVLYYPLFWIWVFINLVSFRPEVVHACDIDTMPPCDIYRSIFRKKIIFDVFDRFAMVYLNPQGKIYRLVNSIEERYAKKCDVLIVVWDKVLESFPGRPKNYSIIMNCPEEIIVHNELNKNGPLKLVYTGNIVKHRGMDAISNAIKDLDGVELHIAGRVIDKDILESLLILKNVKYSGLLPLDEAIRLESTADALVILYDPIIPLHRISIPNKIFTAMMLGIPSITNLESELITKLGCGLSVEYHNNDSIRSAIISLRDDTKLRQRLGKSGHEAFLAKYNWTNMEEMIFRVYENLLSHCK